MKTVQNILQLAIKNEVLDWIKDGFTAEDINGGFCTDFAYTIKHKVKQCKVVKHPLHTWIKLGNKHYDAECVSGVTIYTQLPTFVREHIA